MTRFALLTGGLIVIGVLGFVIDAQSRIPVNRPERTTASGSIYAAGRVEGNTPEIELRFQLAGRVEGLLVEEGQVVRKGEVLVRLDADQHRYEVDQAEAEVSLAEEELKRLNNGARPQERAEAAALLAAKQAEFEQARLSWQRVRDLRDANAISQQEADNKRTAVDARAKEVEAAEARLELLNAPPRADEVAMAQARIQAARARLGLARDRLEWNELRAPSDGQILQLNVEAGELTGPDSPEPVIVMADTSTYRVRAFVEEMDAPRVQVGMSATVTADGLPGRKLKGRVVRLSPRMSRKELWSNDPAERFDTKTREVWIDLQDAEPLVVGLRVDVMIDPASGLSSPDAAPSSDSSQPFN